MISDMPTTPKDDRGVSDDHDHGGDEDDIGASDDDDDHWGDDDDNSDNDGDKIINIPCLNTSSATVNAFCNGVFSGTICNNLRRNNE